MKQLNLRVLKMLALLLFFALMNKSVNAQCTGNTLYATGLAPTSVGNNVTFNCQYAGHYSTLNGVTAGYTYNTTSSNGTDFITITRTSPTGPVVIFGTQPLSWVAPVSGNYYIHTNLDAACGTENSCRTVVTTLTNIPPPPVGCTNTTMNPGTAFNAPTTGTPYQIAACQLQSEYNQMDNVLAGTNFTSTGGIAGTYISVRYGSYNGPLVTAGLSPLTWTAAGAASYFIHYNTDASCGQDFICMASTITNNSVPIPVTADACAPVTVTSSQRPFDGCNLRPGHDQTFAVYIPVAGNWTFSMCGGTSWDSYMYLNTALCGGTTLAFNDDYCAFFDVSSIASTNIPSAGTYYIDIEPYNAFVYDNSFTLTITRDYFLTPFSSASPASSICAGTSLTLNGNAFGAINISWAGPQVVTNGVPFTATTSGIYTITATDIAGCTSTNTISITVNPLPVVTASASPSAICIGESTTITATGATTFDWQPGSLTGPVQVLSPVTNTVYTITGSEPSGCTSLTTVSIVVNPLATLSGTTATLPTICEGSGSQLQTIPGTNPDNYFVASIAYAPVVPQGATNAGPTGDDNVTAPIPIGFPFNFYGATYTDFVISTNGFISFNPLVYHGCCSGGLLPANDGVNNLVALAWNDLNPSMSGSISYYNLTSPNRMVIEFNAVAQYGGGGVPLTGQIIIYDNGNIETHTASVQSDPFDQQTLGIENAAGTFGKAAPGRNSSEWGAINESWLFTPDIATVSWSPAGSLNNSTIVNPVATPTSTTTYTVTATTSLGCTATSTLEVIVDPAPIISAGATPSTTCNNTSVTPAGSGATSYTWSGGLTDGMPFIATGTNTYTVTGTDGIGCTATSSVTVTVNSASGILAPTTSNQSQSHGDDFDIDYYDASCDLIATVDDGNGGNVLGLTTSTVNVDATANFHNTQPFVRRWYQITPTSNGSADVVLYVNQTDFDDYNSVVLPPYLMMPTSGNNGDPNIPNIRITKNDDGGLGVNPIVITPAVNWNGNYWELSFNTPSFSQFRVHSVNPGNVPLPVSITTFDGKKLESTDELTWTTGSEQNNAYFNLQHSTDGMNFATIAKLNSKALNGNSATSLNYNAINSHPALGHNYYRLQQVDIDNKASIHAKIVDLIWGANGSTVNIYPNPTRDILNIDLYTTKVQNTTVKVLDMSGRTIKQVQAKSVAGMNNITISLGEFASGLYTVQVYENDKLMQTGKVRKND